jgi:Zn-dependent peptidase ImmA (M78 family)
MQGFVYKNKSLERLANKSCKDLSLFDNSYPIRMDKLATHIDVEILENNNTEYGFFDGDNKIFINKKQFNAAFKRLIIAHELGHYVAGDGPSHFDGRLSIECEKNANIFAEELLIPEHKLKEQLTVYKKYKTIRDRLALFFGVEKELVVSRCLNLGILI